MSKEGKHPMKLTPAQKQMLLNAYGHPSFVLYGAWDFRCARNLMEKGLVKLSGPGLYFTPEGEKVASQLLEAGSIKIKYSDIRTHIGDSQPVSCPDCSGTGSNMAKYPIVGCATCGDDHAPKEKEEGEEVT